MLTTVLLLTALLQGTTGRITGTIVEARSGAPLAAVLVKVQSTGQQAFSDAEGNFEIADVPAGGQTLLVSVVGYGLVRRDVTVSLTDVVNVTIPVNEGASTYVEEVSVGASRFREAEPGVASQSTLGSREILALRGVVADDPFRAVQVLPGVSTGDDFRAEFAVRGLGPGNIGISIDGVDSPLLFHTVRGVQDTGSLALINSDILESASLLAGPHPQRLNSHLGSRLDFTTRDGARDRLRVRGLLSASAASTVIEGPTGSKATWLVSIRKSYIDWLLRQVDSTTDTTFGFTDGQAKVTIDLTPRQTLRASVIAGRSLLRENENPPDANTLDPAANTTVIGNLHWRFSPSATFTTSQQLYLVNADYRNRVRDGRTREEGNDRDVTWRGSAAWNPKSAHLIEFGAQAQSLSMSRLDRRFTNTSEQLLLDATGDAWSAAGWGHYRWTPSARFAVTPGVRVEHWQLYDQTKASPWLLTDYEVREGTKIRFGAGIQHQSPTLDNALFVPAGRQLVPQRATTIEAGIEQRLGASIRVNLAAYHRREDHGLRAVNNEIRIVNNRVVLPQNPHWENSLTGNTKGAEITIERRAVNGLNGWLSYTWNNSTYEDRRGGSSDPPESFASDYDQRHTVNAYVAYRWSGRTSLSARMRYGSNFPIVGYVAQDANGYLLSSQRNGIRLPAYSRLDLRADRTFTYRKSRLTLFLEVVNAMNRDNYRPNGFGVNLTTRRVFDPIESLFPLLPVAGVLIEF
ncbi:MAG: TonB-dependent receptor [Cyanobacteria bacterium]|nr:TonB-dependent receptor [Cyanobacteriota bacterium]